MAIKDSATEEHIKDTARRIFFVEGRFHATTQEIAEAAGVNRTLLNYYFRSKDALIEQVFRQAQLSLKDRMKSALLSELPFKEKIEHFIDLFHEQSATYPYMDSYLASQLNEHLANGCLVDEDPEQDKQLAQFLNEVSMEMERGTIVASPPVHFLINLISVMSYPAVMKPLFQKILQLDEHQYRILMAERKKVILDQLFKS